MTLRARTLAALAALPLSTLALAAEDAPPAGSDPMAGWKPPVVKQEKKDRQEIQALWAKMEAAAKAGDVEAAASLIDFPVLMATDDAKGEGSAVAWSREQWVDAMRPMYKPMPDAKMTHKPNVSLLTDSLAVVSDQWTMTHGKQKMSGRSAVLLLRKQGEWKVKMMAEGGWGDMMASGGGEKPAGAGQ